MSTSGTLLLLVSLTGTVPSRLLTLARTGDILEIGALVSIRSRDIPSFDRYFAQLQTFYIDYRCAGDV